MISKFGLSGSGKQYRYVPNSHHLEDTEVAEIYKERWQIEQFFKWIKQDLNIKNFLGTSENAVLIQVWIALCFYLLVAFLKFKTKLGCSMTQRLRVLQLNLFARSGCIRLFKPPACRQLILRSFLSGAKLRDSTDLKLENVCLDNAVHFNFL